VPAAEVFRAVADEVAYAIDVHNTCLMRFEPDGSGVLVAAHNEAGLKAMPVGARLDLHGDNVAAMVLSTGRPARMNTHEDAAGPAAALIRDLGLSVRGWCTGDRRRSLVGNGNRRIVEQGTAAPG
jgi:hypothetical protein